MRGLATAKGVTYQDMVPAAARVFRQRKERSEAFDLEAAVIRPDKKAVNPAKPLMQRVADAKENNDPVKIPALHHQFYEIMEVAINPSPQGRIVRMEVVIAPSLKEEKCEWT